MNEISLDEHLLKKESKIRPNKQRAKNAQILLWMVLAVNIITIFSSYMQYNVLLDLQNGIEISDKLLDTNDTREIAVNVLYLIVFIISAITYIQWFRRAYYNLNVRASCERVDGWAAGCWFIPIVSFYLPYKIMIEMWTKTSRLIQLSKGDESYNNNSDSSIVGLWWALWVISNISANIVNQIYKEPATVDSYIDSTKADIFVSIMFIPTTFLAIYVIKKYSEKEEELLNIENDNSWN